jgi:hypothetical protein
MLEKLTADQEALIPVVRDQWTQIGFSTGATDHAEAESAMRLVYERAFVPFPASVIWFPSPMKGCLEAQRLLNEQAKRDGTEEVSLSTVLGTAIYGSHDAGWLAFYQFFKQIGFEEVIKPLDGLLELSKGCGWCWCYDTVVIMTEKPTRIELDDQKRLHSEDHPALEYSDGFAIYSWHGVRVDEDIIMRPESPTLERAMKETNQEIRRITLERYGWHRVMADLGAVTIHEDNFGKLVETEKLATLLDGEDPKARFVIVKDASTDRIYALRVDPSMETAQAAVAWTFQVEPKSYDPQQQS